MLLTESEVKIFRKLNSPAKVQDFLNSIPNNKERTRETCMSPRFVLKKNKAHCAEGALLASAIFLYHGRKPYLLDLKTTKDDLDHVVALFRENGFWGAVSKTNHGVLRYREPIYKTIRELALSYFHEYYLDDGRKTLRSFSKPFNLGAYDEDWVTADFDLWSIMDDLDKSPHTNLLNKQQLKNLRKVDRVEVKAGLIAEW